MSRPNSSSRHERVQLALAQVARLDLRNSSAETRASPTEELLVTTTGDRVQDVALSQIGGKGVFIKEIEEALLDRRADLAVHSLKDVPAELAPSLVIGCIPLREDPRDAIVTRDGSRFEELRSGQQGGHVVAASRCPCFARWRADLEYVPIRGNVDTRLRRSAKRVWSTRSCSPMRGCAPARTRRARDRNPRIRRVGLPAIGQGALAIERRADDAEAAALLDVLTHDGDGARRRRRSAAS